MDQVNVITKVRDSLKLMNETSEEDRNRGLDLLEAILAEKDKQVVELGYDKVIIKQLLKFAKFETGQCLVKALDLIVSQYCTDLQCHDDIMETLIYRYGISTNTDVSLECLKKISLMIDHMDDNIAKHSKQILQIADLHSPTSLKPVIIEILRKLKTKLPTRKHAT